MIFWCQRNLRKKKEKKEKIQIPRLEIIFSFLCPYILCDLQALLILLVPSVMIPLWHKTTTKIEHDAKLSSLQLRTELISQVERTAELLHPMNASALNFARVLNASLMGVDLTFSEITERV